ncbi:MAG: TonB family protein [Balneolaceae bacterium]|nr:TonB family protein [Balneolaceae bacterium]MBO6544887.1 TonB family protein [Balneolaceae bacterium]MBO6646283.1 TonB family protein [Balneolaceae bacterium]
MFPLLIWSVVAFIAFVALKHASFLNPLYQYHLRFATLAAVLFGVFASYAIHQVRQSTISNVNFEGAIFVVQSPIELTVSAQPATSVFQPDFLNPNFLIGAITCLLALVSLFFLIRLLTSYISLKRLYQTLETSPLEGFETSNKEIQLAFHDHPLVPFTFGWIKPVIVLPKRIKDQPEKVQMAIQHELVHIERGDYLLQLFLSVIESVLWFHPLIRLGAKEIETYREISCDQQVLSTTQVSTKKYASMLYELVPLERGLSGFSVSMAVKQSTLKQRIETMKHHKLYKTSLKRSLLFFFAMTLLITLPIACSDLQGQQVLSSEQLQDERITVMSHSISINDKVVLDKSPGGGNGPGIGSAFFGTKDHGIFVVALHEIENAKKSGSISGERILFSINGLDVEIISNGPILENNKEADIWVKHFPDYSVHGVSGFFTQRDVDFEEHFKDFKAFSNETGKYYKVPDQMPELIGGLTELQKNVEYPEEARRTGIQGRVTLQFIVDEQGNVVNPRVMTGIGGGCDEAALTALANVKFKPGIKNGEPVKTQYSLPVIFRLTNTFDNTDAQNTFSSEHSDGREMQIFIFEDSNGKLELRVTDKNKFPLEGAVLRFEGNNQGIISGKDGLITATNLEPGNHNYIISHTDYWEMKMNIFMEE